MADINALDRSHYCVLTHMLQIPPYCYRYTVSQVTSLYEMTFSNNGIPGSPHELGKEQTALAHAFWLSKHASFLLTKKLHNWLTKIFQPSWEYSRLWSNKKFPAFYETWSSLFTTDRHCSRELPSSCVVLIQHSATKWPHSYRTMKTAVSLPKLVVEENGL